jgi:HK97 gp10 family phage protein
MPLKHKGKRIRAIKKRLGPNVRAAVEQSASDIVASQRNLAPVEDGDLKQSIVYTMGDQDPPKYAAFKDRSGGAQGDPSMAAIITAGNSKVRYAHLVEFGTAPHLNGGMFAGTQHPGTSPQPFFWPGYRANKKKVKSRIARAVNKAIKDSV